MDNAKKQWPILRELETDLENKVREFMVIGKDGKGLIVATEDGLAYWIGKMQFKMCGKSKTATKLTSLDVPELISMAQSDSHILLLNKRGKIYSMGINNNGQLGLGTVDKQTHFLPQLIPSLHKFTSVRCGNEHSVALTKDGKVWAWGSNLCGQTNVSKSAVLFHSPLQISELDHHRIVEVECGGSHSLALTDQGEVYAWGWNNFGQLGNGSSLSPQTSTLIPTPSPVKSMAAGNNHTLLLTKKGEVYSSGRNDCDQLGSQTSISSSPTISKVDGLPSILQIASHHLTRLSIAISSDHRCFVWGRLTDGTSISTPRKLDSSYSTVESPLSSFSHHRSTPHSVTIPAREYSRKTDLTTQTESCHISVLNQTPPNRILDQMFNNPDSCPDIRFQVEDQDILAHRCVLQKSSGLFCRHPDLNQPFLVNLNSQSDPTTNTSEPEYSTNTTSNRITIPIPDHSYPAFHAYLRFLYLGILTVSPEHLADLFSLSVAYLESDLQQLCLSRMRTTLTPATCCLYYPLTHLHSFPELSTFQQELVQFISTRTSEVYRTGAYLSMDDRLCKKLAISISNLSNNLWPIQSAIPKPKKSSQSSPTSKRLRTNS